MSIARARRGRTVREFVVCVLPIPSPMIFVWMCVFGMIAMDQAFAGPEMSQVKEYVIDTYSPELSLLGMLSGLPLTGLVSTVAIALTLIVFVTSSASGSLVIDTITAGDKIDAPKPQRMFWATIEGLIAIVLLVGGRLAALRAGVTATGLPFPLVLLAMCYAIWIALEEPR